MQHPTDATRGDRTRLYVDEILTSLGAGSFWVAFVVAVSGDPQIELLLSATIIARFGPRAVLSAPIGRLVDRVSLRPLLVTIDVLRAASMAVLTVLVVLDAPAWTLVAAIAAYAVVSVPARIASSVALARVCSERELAGANVTLSTIGQVMTFVGPLVGAALCAWSVTVALVSAMIAFAASAAAMATLQGAALAATPARHVGARADLRSVEGGRGDAVGLRWLTVLIAAMYFLRGTEMVLHVLVVRDLARAAPERLGILSGAIGLGAMITMPVAARAARSARAALILRGAVALSAVPTAALAATTTVSSAAALLLLVGIGMVLFEVVSVVTIQRVAPRDRLGRVFGSVNTASNASKLVGAVLAPAVVAVVGTSAALVVVGAAVVLAGIVATPAIGRLVETAEVRRLALEPVVTVLRGLDLFAAASHTALERIAAVALPLDLRPGDEVVREGEPADAIYVVREGRLEVTVRGQPVNSIGPDDWFGEIGLVQRTPRTATVNALTPAQVWRIPGDVFLAALEESGAPPSGLLAGIAARLAQGAA